MTTENTVRNLLTKSQEAFIVGIELYNKPTIQYRVEGFSFFICNAWELLLKAYLLQTKGEESVYYANNKHRTISLSKCITLMFTNKKDPLRMNLEQICDLRNTSTHFITTEYEQIYVPLFQACVMNYANKLLEYFGIDITERISANFLTLSVKISPFEPEEVLARHTKPVADRLLRTLKQVHNSMPAEGNDKYAVLIKHDIYITKKPDLATATIAISSDAETSAFVLKSPSKDMQNTCPYRRSKCIDLINRRIKSEKLNFINPSKSPDDEKYHVFNTNHFDLIVKFYHLKEDPQYCYKYDRTTQTHFSYSDATINFIMDKIKKDPENIIQKLREKQNKS